MGKSKKQSNSVLERIAAKHGVSVEEVVRDMQIAIDETWDKPNPLGRKHQLELFPTGKPSIEEFIDVTAKEAKDRK